MSPADLVMNLLLGKDYLITRQAWDKLGYLTPLVMTTVQSWVCNRQSMRYGLSAAHVTSISFLASAVQWNSC